MGATVLKLKKKDSHVLRKVLPPGERRDAIVEGKQRRKRVGQTSRARENTTPGEGDGLTRGNEGDEDGDGVSLLGLGDRLALAALGVALGLMGLGERLGLDDSLLLGTGLLPGCHIHNQEAS